MAKKITLIEDNNYYFNDETDDLNFSIKGDTFGGSVKGVDDFLNKFSIKVKKFNADLEGGQAADLLKISAYEYVGSISTGAGNDKVVIKSGYDSHINVDLGTGNDIFSYKGSENNSLFIDSGSGELKSLKFSHGVSDVRVEMGDADHEFKIKALDSNYLIMSEGDGDVSAKINFKNSDLVLQNGAGDHVLNAKLDNSTMRFSSEDQGADIDSTYQIKAMAKNNSEFKIGDLDDGDFTGLAKASTNSELSFSLGKGDHFLKLSAAIDSNLSFTQTGGEQGQITDLRVKLSKNSDAEIIQTSGAQLILNASAKEGQVFVESGMGNDLMNVKGVALEIDVDSGEGNDSLSFKGKKLDVNVMSGVGDDYLAINGKEINISTDMGSGNDLMYIKGDIKGIISGGEGTDTLSVNSALDLNSNDLLLNGFEEFLLNSSKSKIYLGSESLGEIDQGTKILGKGKLILSGEYWQVSTGSKNLNYLTNGEALLYVEDTVKFEFEHAESVVDYRSEISTLQISSKTDVYDLIEKGFVDVDVLQLTGEGEIDLNYEVINDLRQGDSDFYIEGSKLSVNFSDSGWKLQESLKSYDIYVNNSKVIYVNKKLDVNVFGGDTPHDVIFYNVISPLSDKVDTTSAIKYADYTILDDESGVHEVYLSGDNAKYFEIIDKEIFIREGVQLDHLVKDKYRVILNVDDPSNNEGLEKSEYVDLKREFTLYLENPERTEVKLVNYVESLSENTDTSTLVKLGDIQTSEDLNSAYFRVFGDDSKYFEIVDGNQLYLDYNVELDFETKNSFDAYIGLFDRYEDGGVIARKYFEFTLTDLDEAPTDIDILYNLNEIDLDIDTSVRVKLADLELIDDALGSNEIVLLTIHEIGLFEVDNNKLYLAEGADLSTIDGEIITGGLKAADQNIVTYFSFDLGSMESSSIELSISDIVFNLDENASKESSVKIADVILSGNYTDANNFNLVGEDAELFELVDGGIFVTQGDYLNYELQQIYNFRLEVEGTELFHDFSLTVNDVDELPQALQLTNTINHVNEIADTSFDVKIADIIITDDALGNNFISLSGADSDYFKVENSSLYLKSGFDLSDHTKLKYDVVVTVDDTNLSETYSLYRDDLASFVISNSADNSYPEITSFENGDYLVVWMDSAIFGSMYNSSGEIIKDDFKISNSPGIEFDSSVAELNDGGFVVVWESLSGDYDIYGSLYDASGQVVEGKGDFIISDEENWQTDPHVLSMKNGNILVTWSAREDNDTYYDIYGAIYNQSGDLERSKFLLADVSNTQWLNYSVSSLKNGNFVVVWDDRAGSPVDIDGRIYNSSGNLVKDLTFDMNESGVSPDLTSLEGGGFVITYKTYQGINGSVYTNSGKLINENFVITDQVSTQDDQEVVGLEDGGFVVVWRTKEDGDWTLNGSLFDKFGNVISDKVNFLISTSLDAHAAPSVSSTNNGGFIVSWVNDEDDGGFVMGKRYDSSGESMEPFIQNDSSIIISDELSEISGGDGNNDALVLQGINLDFTTDNTIAERISGIEQIDLKLDLEVNILHLDVNAVSALTNLNRNINNDQNSGTSNLLETSDLLRISGGQNDLVSASGFSDTGVDVTVNYVEYDLYRNDLHADLAFLLEQGVGFV